MTCSRCGLDLVADAKVFCRSCVDDLSGGVCHSCAILRRERDRLFEILKRAIPDDRAEERLSGTCCAWCGFALPEHNMYCVVLEARHYMERISAVPIPPEMS